MLLPRDVRPPYSRQTPEGLIEYTTRIPAEDNQVVHVILEQQCVLHPGTIRARPQDPKTGRVVFCLAAIVSSKTRSRHPMFFFDAELGRNRVIFSPQALARMEIEEPLTQVQWEKLEATVLGWLRSMPLVVDKVRMWDREVLVMVDESKDIGEDGWMEAWLYYPGEVQNILRSRRMMSEEEARTFVNQIVR